MKGWRVYECVNENCGGIKTRQQDEDWPRKEKGRKGGGIKEKVVRRNRVECLRAGKGRDTFMDEVVLGKRQGKRARGRRMDGFVRIGVRESGSLWMGPSWEGGGKEGGGGRDGGWHMGTLPRCLFYVSMGTTGGGKIYKHGNS